MMGTRGRGPRVCMPQCIQECAPATNVRDRSANMRNILVSAQHPFHKESNPLWVLLWFACVLSVLHSFVNCKKWKSWIHERTSENDNQGSMVHHVNNCNLYEWMRERRRRWWKQMTSHGNLWLNWWMREWMETNGNARIKDCMNKWKNKWITECKKRSTENTLMQTPKKWVNDWVNGGIIHHSLTHEVGSSNPVRIGQMVSGTTCWCWSLTMTAENELVPANEFPCKVSCSTCLFQGQRWHCAYKYDIWPLLSTNPLLIFRINQKSSVAISLRPTKPFCTFFRPNFEVLVSNRKKKTPWGIFWKVTENRSPCKFKANPKRNKANPKRNKANPKRTPKWTQSKTKRTKRTPKRTTFHHFFGYFWNCEKIAIFVIFETVTFF